MITKGVLAVGNDGQKLLLPGKAPRAELMERLGRRHADKVYVDTPAGPKHVGYVVGRVWWNLYDIQLRERPA